MKYYADLTSERLLALVLLAAFPEINKAFVGNFLVIMTFLKST